ncbi:MAG: hypothetical protein HGA62_03125 [Chlorobiaceae bacterium]|nr:hypothetical protein [Chlorobiaceae bacterium]NTV61133.1 hypothetical protein [Chlorobiaceae bacterium]
MQFTLAGSASINMNNTAESVFRKSRAMDCLQDGWPSSGRCSFNVLLGARHPECFPLARRINRVPGIEKVGASFGSGRVPETMVTDRTERM